MLCNLQEENCNPHIKHIICELKERVGARGGGGAVYVPPVF
jgi:hypothetical protein